VKEHLMQNVAVQKAGQMPQPLKAAVEQILGRAIGADEEISIVAVPPQQVAPSEGKAAVVAKLEALLNRRAEKVRDIPEEEINSLVDEAVQQARHHRR
jgi:hypothetical protein